jgi:hypothetical protein
MTHGRGDCAAGNNQDEWSIGSDTMTLGNRSYTRDDLCSILNTTPQGHGLLTLAHQLIAAKLNILAGADPSCIAEAIADADMMIGDLVVGTDFLSPGDVAALVQALDDYNNGRLECASHCEEPTPTPTPTATPTPPVIEVQLAPCSVEGNIARIQFIGDLLNLTFLLDGAPVVPDAQGFLEVAPGLHTWEVLLNGVSIASDQIQVPECDPTPTPSGTPTPTPTPTPTSAGCTVTLGFYATHGEGDCHSGNNETFWPIDHLFLGNVDYTADQLCSILNTPVGGNHLSGLARQLIAAKFNVINGADPSAIQATITAADTLIGDLVVMVDDFDQNQNAEASALTLALNNWNTGVTGPGHCVDAPLLAPTDEDGNPIGKYNP